MAKSISFKNVKPPSADEWVGTSETERSSKPSNGEPTKRFTIDVSRSLHTRIKAECARREIKMADMMREWLEQRFPMKPGGE